MEQQFEIISYVGAGPLLFGLTQTEVEGAVGQPLRMGVNNLGEKNAQYRAFSLRYSVTDSVLLEIGFTSSANVMFRGLNLFRDPEALRKLLHLDSYPYESYGFIVLFDLGITLTVFHDDDKAQIAVTAFALGRWDGVKP